MADRRAKGTPMQEVFSRDRPRRLIVDYLTDFSSPMIKGALIWAPDAEAAFRQTETYFRNAIYQAMQRGKCVSVY